MKKTSLKEKLSLILFGIFLSLVFLEIGLRMAGGIVFYLQQRHNHVSFDPNEYRILCLGESTTALGFEDSYPSQLQEMLNAESPQKKFTVINRGIVSTTTNYILAHADENLDIYKPQLVIVMMGINDRYYIHDLHKVLWWENIKSRLEDLRVYKLGHLLYEHITHRIREFGNPAQTPDDLSQVNDENYQQVEDFLKLVITNCVQKYHEHMYLAAQYLKQRQLGEAHQETKFAGDSAVSGGLACIELSRRYRLQGSFKGAQAILATGSILDPNYPGIAQQWGELYLAQEKYPEAAKAFGQAIALDPKNSDALQGLARAYYQEHNDEAFLVYAGYLQINPKDYWSYIELAQWLIKSKHYDLAQVYLSHAIELEPDFEQAYADLGQMLDDQGQYQKEEAFYLKEISLRPQSPLLYKALGQFYQRLGKENLSKEYFQKAVQFGMAEYLPVTLVNYSLLLDKILKRHIKVIVMQYPLRDIGPLKDYLGQRNGVVFVENKQNFKQALTSEGYSYYFKDSFGHNFGHCTRQGNELIARNLKNCILSSFNIR